LIRLVFSKLALNNISESDHALKQSNSGEKSSQQKTPPRMTGRRLVLWQVPALFSMLMLL
jgi:hypothetical protein